VIEQTWTVVTNVVWFVTESVFTSQKNYFDLFDWVIKTKDWSHTSGVLKYILRISEDILFW
jgi:hypothetical protein